MKRKIIATIVGFLLVALLCVAYGAWRLRESKRESQEILAAVHSAVQDEVQKKLAEATLYSQKKAIWSASCAGETTVLVLDLTNPASAPLKEIRYHRLVLGGRTPEESLPAVIDEVKPGATTRLTFHFKRVPWQRFGDINTEYNAPLDTETTFPGGTENYAGIPVKLDKDSVCILEEQRAKHR